MNQEILIRTVARIMVPAKGILAIDESLPTCAKRFEKLGVPTTEEKRREYRELLITAPDIEKYISGYILFDETIRQSTRAGKSFISILRSKGIEIGIKVDQGLVDFPSHPGEKITKGIDGLSDRLKEYKKFGAVFAKWRAVYTVGENTPSVECMRENALLLAKFSVMCQELDIVPIIEPEVLIDGNYTIEKSFETNARNLDIVFSELENLNVFIPGVILKNSFVFSGKEASNGAGAEKVAEMTLKCFREHVPADIGGIVFISGGQPDNEAMINLNAVHKMGALPCSLSFSYGRAIQNRALESWAKNPIDTAHAQALLLEDARSSSLATLGQYK